ncbi:MAG: hypothetical protein CMM27_10660 [Rhodospirillaceae bacterium]|nr:hypothetical protein [Rhodospirillaceae bacterium]|tara:strand:+ start:713 stop:892 length:180 start_codon:yes stop_codon:yes gene_type:complete
MEETQIDIQVVINKLTNTIAQLTADLAVKDALIEALQKSDEAPSLSVVGNAEDTEEDGA